MLLTYRLALIVTGEFRYLPFGRLAVQIKDKLCSDVMIEGFEFNVVGLRFIRLHHVPVFRVSRDSRRSTV